MLCTVSMSASLWGCELKWFLGSCGELREIVSLLVRLWVEILMHLHIRRLTLRQPPCEAVSWNITIINSIPVAVVSLLVRLWVEIWDNCRQFCTRIVSLLVRLWVEMYWDRYSFCPKRRQPPCEAVSWNVLNCVLLTTPFSQPPCEAVSWNNSGLLITAFSGRQPPCEAVSWNTEGCDKDGAWQGQPPCEAVSWNHLEETLWTSDEVSLLVRLWVEIHYLVSVEVTGTVSLLVRLWVEMPYRLNHNLHTQSASLWGCELKYHPFRVYMGRLYVSLLVRLWVEINIHTTLERLPLCQPPCEAVSWNNDSETNVYTLDCQPPCEAVSWNRRK